MFRVFVKFSTSKLYKLLLTTYELFVNCTTGNMCSYIYDQIWDNGLVFRLRSRPRLVDKSTVYAFSLRFH